MRPAEIIAAQSYQRDLQTRFAEISPLHRHPPRPIGAMISLDGAVRQFYSIREDGMPCGALAGTAIFLAARSVRHLAAFVLEEFHLLQSFLGFLLGFVRPTQVFPFFGENFVTAGDFLDHECTSIGAIAKRSRTV